WLLLRRGLLRPMKRLSFSLAVLVFGFFGAHLATVSAQDATCDANGYCQQPDIFQTTTGGADTTAPASPGDQSGSTADAPSGEAPAQTCNARLCSSSDGPINMPAYPSSDAAPAAASTGSPGTIVGGPSGSYEVNTGAGTERTYTAANPTGTTNGSSVSTFPA